MVVEAASEGTDTVNSRQTYTLGANIENLALTGTGSINGTGNVLDNVLTGNAGANTLGGGEGNDTLNDGMGNDTLTGGIGSDAFAFDNLTSFDAITDYDAGNDVILLVSSGAFASLTLGVLSAEAFWEGSAAHDADDRIIYDNATGELYYDADGIGSGSVQIQFATLVGVPAGIVNTEFVVI